MSMNDDLAQGTRMTMPIVQPDNKKQAEKTEERKSEAALLSASAQFVINTVTKELPTLDSFVGFLETIDRNNFKTESELGLAIWYEFTARKRAGEIIDKAIKPLKNALRRTNKGIQEAKDAAGK